MPGLRKVPQVMVENDRDETTALFPFPIFLFVLWFYPFSFVFFFLFFLRGLTAQEKVRSHVVVPTSESPLAGPGRR